MNPEYSEERALRVAWQIDRLSKRHAVGGECGLNGWAVCSCDLAVKIRELSEKHTFISGYRKGYAAAKEGQ